jgi:hypothetical protein
MNRIGYRARVTGIGPLPSEGEQLAYPGLTRGTSEGNIMQLLLFLALGLIIGGISGMLGIGGGVLLLPALIWLFGLEPRQAAGVTLAVLAVPVTLPGAWQYYEGRLIRSEHLRMALWIAIAFGVGTYLGARVQGYVPAAVLRVSFGLLMIYVAVRLILNSSSDVAVAAAGLSSMAVALTVYFGLKVLGRRHMLRPDLGAQIRAAQEQGRGDIEYHI